MSGRAGAAERRRLPVTHPAWGVSFTAWAGAVMCCSALLAMAALSGRWGSSAGVAAFVLLAAGGFQLLVARRWRSWRPAFTHAGIATGEVSLLLVTLLSSGGVLPYVSVATFTWAGAFAGLYLPRRAVLAHVVLMNAMAATALNLLTDAASAWTALALLVPCTSGLAVITFVLARELRQQTEQDPLTGLPNRRGLARRTEEEQHRRRPARCVVVLDLDRFKQVNDTHGHEAGDRLLVEIAARWSAVLGPDDVLARTGGDEFALLHRGSTDSAAALVEALRRVTPDVVGVSAGVARWDHGAAFERCSAVADASLYRAKNTRRGTTVVEVPGEPEHRQDAVRS